MEVGNVETHGTKDSQRQTDQDNNSFFTCHHVGCRPWNIRLKRLRKLPIITLTWILRPNVARCRVKNRLGKLEGTSFKRKGTFDEPKIQVVPQLNFYHIIMRETCIAIFQSNLWYYSMDNWTVRRLWFWRMTDVKLMWFQRMSLIAMLLYSTWPNLKFRYPILRTEPQNWQQKLSGRRNWKLGRMSISQTLKSRIVGMMYSEGFHSISEGNKKWTSVFKWVNVDVEALQHIPVQDPNGGFRQQLFVWRNLDLYCVKIYLRMIFEYGS